MEVNYTHDDAVRNLCIAGDEDIPLPERLEARERVAAYIERLEAERDSERRWANQYSAERDEWEAVARWLAVMCEGLECDLGAQPVWDSADEYLAAAQEAVRHE